MKHAIYLIGGLIFGFGLALSGMANPQVVLGFLHFKHFGLMLVMGGAILVALPVFTLVRKPLLAPEASLFKGKTGGRFLLGSVLFGVGWGLSGVCPAAAFAGLGSGIYGLGVAILAMFLGALAQAHFLPDRD